MERLKVKPLYLIPSALTYMNMILGIMSIFIGMDGGFLSIKRASTCIILAAFTDKLDGYAARKLKATSDFGRELDSLSDMVSFGIAPILLGFSLIKSNLGSSYIIASIFYIGSAAFRLARFNIESEEEKITGLPITIAGAILAVKYLIDLFYGRSLSYGADIVWENNFLIISLSLLMLASFKFNKPNIIDKDLF